MNTPFALTRAVTVFAMSVACTMATFAQEVLNLRLGQSQIVQLDQAIQRVAVGNPNIADYILLGAKELYIVGKHPGATNLVTWTKSGRAKTMDIQVKLNVAPLQSLLKQLLPNESGITIETLGDTVILNGLVADAAAADVATRITNSQLDAMAFYTNSQSTTEQTQTDKASKTATPQNAQLRLVNLIKVREPQQVMLEVRVAEVSKSYLESLGVEFGTTGGLNPKSLMTGFVSNATLSMMFGKGAVQRVNPDGTPLYSNRNDSVNIEAQRTDGWVKILAEPTIVAMSGHEGRFLVGGKIFIPVNQALGSTTYEERSYGVGLKFLPTVLSSGRINLQVAPEISVPVTKAVTAGTNASLPAFKSSYVSTTVQMAQGQNLVIAGLLRDNVNEVVKAVPGLGELPILGALFRHSEYVTDRTELVIVVRPSLVHAQTTEPPLPTDHFDPPTRSEFFLEGKAQATAPEMKKSAQTDPNLAYRAYWTLP